MEVKNEQNLVEREPSVSTEEELKVKSSLKSGEGVDRSNVVQVYSRSVNYPTPPPPISGGGN